MERNIYELKNADSKTAKKIFEISPPDWEMDNAFEKSYRKSRQLSGFGDVVDDPLEIVEHKSKRRIYVAASIASAVCAAIALIIVIPMMKPTRNPDNFNDNEPLFSITTQASHETSATSATSVTSMIKTSAISTSATQTEKSTSVETSTKQETSQPAKTEPPSEPNEPEKTEPQSEPNTSETPPPTEQSPPPHEYQKLPQPSNYASSDEYNNAAIDGIINGKYFFDFNGDGRLNRLDAQVILRYSADSASPFNLEELWMKKITCNEYTLSEVQDFYQLYDYTIDDYDPDIVYINELYTLEMLENVLKFGDITGDGIINSKDASCIIRICDAYKAMT